MPRQSFSAAPLGRTAPGLLLLALALVFLGARCSVSQSPDAFLLPRDAVTPTAAGASAAAARGAEVLRSSADSAGDYGCMAFASMFACAGSLALGLRSRRAGASVRAAGQQQQRAVVAMAAAKTEVEADDEDEEYSDEDEFDAMAYSEDDDDELDDYEYDDEPEAQCRAKHLRGSPQKFRRVLWQIRGRSYRDVLMLLEFLPWRHCKPVLKAVQAAAASAQNHFNMDKSRLYISYATADKAKPLKRMRPVSKGQAHTFWKHMTHLTVRVKEMSDEQIARQMEKQEAGY